MRHQIFNSMGDYIYNGIVYENFEFPFPNFHNSFELYYIMEGHLTAMVNASTTELETGDLFLIAPNMPHSLHKHGNNKYFTGVFSADFIPTFVKTDLHAPFIKFQITDSTLPYLREHMFYTGTPNFFELKSCLYAVCEHVKKGYENDTQNTPPIDCDFVLKVNDYVSKNWEYNFTRQEIAEALNYEEHYFSYLFNLNFQVNVRTYLNIIRLSNACQLLKNTDMSITSIVKKCGFGGIRSFNLAFQKYYGQTPTQYRHTASKITEPDIYNS